ncbi:MAG: tRNA (N6-isopentenyl adenosine(37)-C2)-methylthiotransferase MiaB, partial [Elusimicrobia bacterium]|nr:tRNA (N6-isopentenyl adenosine(37)-C2)-methylthiotransferase MiaB [Elusimicrobiota bacterium]
VGFPTESEEDFAQTISLIKEVGVSSAYCFKYSAREGTASAKMAGAVSPEVIKKRHGAILSQVKAQARIKQ